MKRGSPVFWEDVIVGAGDMGCQVPLQESRKLWTGRSASYALFTCKYECIFDIVQARRFVNAQGQEKATEASDSQMDNTKTKHARVIYEYLPTVQTLHA